LDIFIAAQRHLRVGRPFKAGFGNPIPYRIAERRIRSQTPTVGGIQAPLTRRGFPAWDTQVPALKGRPTVKRRDAAAKPAFLCQISSLDKTLVS